MNISNPFNIPIRSPDTSRPHSRSWNRRMQQAGAMAQRPPVGKEEDLDHLGALHKQHETAPKR